MRGLPRDGTASLVVSYKKGKFQLKDGGKVVRKGSFLHSHLFEVTVSLTCVWITRWECKLFGLGGGHYLFVCR